MLAQSRQSLGRIGAQGSAFDQQSSFLSIGHALRNKEVGFFMRVVEPALPSAVSGCRRVSQHRGW